jgi:stringent starvation protein B
MVESLDAQGTSTRPYLLRALHDWCSDNGYTPYIAVHVAAGVQVPMEYVKNNEIVLNVGFDATSGLQLGNEFVEFKARFGGVAREIKVPVDHVVAIYARENGQGMAFPMPTAGGAKGGSPVEVGTNPVVRGLRLASTDTGAGEVPMPPAAPEAAGDPPPDPTTPAGGRPTLKRIK